MSKKINIIESEGYPCINLQDLMYINTSAKWWFAEIQGVDEKYGFKRQFINGFLRDSKGRKTTRLPVSKIPVGTPLELVGGSWKNRFYTYFIVTEITDDYISIKEYQKGEIESMLNKENKDEKLAVNLARQLVKMVGKKKAQNLIKTI